MIANQTDEIFWGISCGHHDAAISVVQDNFILYASHAERYSKKKNDLHLNDNQIKNALEFGVPSKIFFYENSFIKKIRYFKSGQYKSILKNDFNDVESKLKKNYPSLAKTYFFQGDHHLSHAAAGFYTSSFENAVVIVADAIGEISTLSIYIASNSNLSKEPIFKINYPHSLGLFYSHFTESVGLKPNEDEYIFMAMAALGDNKNDFLGLRNKITLKNGSITDWRSDINFHRKKNYLIDTEQKKFDVAAVCQDIVEHYLKTLFCDLEKLFPYNFNWVFSGGIALNCVANSKIVNSLRDYSQFYIYPNPGDAGSSLGSILAYTNKKIELPNTFLGFEIKSSNIDNNDLIVDELVENQICGVARGKAEFGPRSLGNRSLLADPRGIDIKNTLNSVKRRQSFRPFGVSILEEEASHYFKFPKNIKNSPFMQYAVQVIDPNIYPSICHADGTCRIQTVTRSENPKFHDLLTKWFKKTNCPFLINTSLNIKGQPIINSLSDCLEFEKTYKIKVFN